MTIELAPLISVISVCFAIYMGVINIRRNNKSDDKTDATQLTMVIVKLENIGMGITDIKNDMSNLKNDMKEDRERIVKVEEAIKALNKRFEDCRTTNTKGEI